MLLKQRESLVSAIVAFALIQNFAALA